MLGKKNNTGDINTETDIIQKADEKKLGLTLNQKYTSIFSPKYGNKDAENSVIMFFDFDCPYCYEEYNIFKSVIGKYYNNTYFEFRQFPIETIHPNSRALANASLCANEQEKFLEMFNVIYDDFNSRESSDQDIKIFYDKYAVQISLDINKFNKCMGEKKYDKIVNKDTLDALNLNLEGTPTFFVNGTSYKGVLSSEKWDQLLK